MSKYGDEARAILAKHTDTLVLAESLADQLKKDGKLKTADEAKLNELKTKGA
jgi:hypothetical protein